MSDNDASRAAPSPLALLIIDMINDLEFPEGPSMESPALAAARNIARLKERARAQGMAVIYANDNFGRWRSNFQQVVEHCTEDGVRGNQIAKVLRPSSDDYFVLKPKHSAFYATPLDLLLEHLQVRALVLTGITGHMCVQFTAADAYMRDYKLYVPADCMASHTDQLNQRSLDYMAHTLAADLTASQQLDLRQLVADARG